MPLGLLDVPKTPRVVLPAGEMASPTTPAAKNALLRVNPCKPVAPAVSKSPPSPLVLAPWTPVPVELLPSTPAPAELEPLTPINPPDPETPMVAPEPLTPVPLLPFDTASIATGLHSSVHPAEVFTARTVAANTPFDSATTPESFPPAADRVPTTLTGPLNCPARALAGALPTIAKPPGVLVEPRMPTRPMPSNATPPGLLTNKLPLTFW